MSLSLYLVVGHLIDEDVFQCCVSYSWRKQEGVLMPVLIGSLLSSRRIIHYADHSVQQAASSDKLEQNKMKVFAFFGLCNTRAASGIGKACDRLQLQRDYIAFLTLKEQAHRPICVQSI